MCQGIDITIKIRSGSAGQREVLLPDGRSILEQDTVNWVVHNPCGSVLDYGCDVVELIEQYGRGLGLRDTQPSVTP